MEKNQLHKLGTGIAAAFSLLCLVACGQKTSFVSLSSSSPTTAIIDGDSVSATDLISQTTVAVYNQSSKGLCTGTLIRENLVLTAGHCALGAGPGDLVVIFTQDATQDSQIRRRVLGGMVPTKFAKLMTSQEHPPEKDWQDMAVLKIEGHELPAGFKIASLLFGTQLLPKTETVLLAGYGLNSIQPDPQSRSGYKGGGSGVLRKTPVTLTDADYSASEILVSMTDGKGACHGDSGGPAYLVRRGGITVVGVTSRSDSNTGAVDCTGGTIYTSVPAMQDFIKQAAIYLESTNFHVGQELGSL
jgi:secreted trypsin-like serine protease